MPTPTPAGPDGPPEASEDGSAQGQYLPGTEPPLRLAGPAGNESGRGLDDPPSRDDGTQDDGYVPL